MKNEMTLEEFRKAAKIGRTKNAHGFLSGASRQIAAIEVRWLSKAGERKLHFGLVRGSRRKGVDYVAACFAELSGRCIIRDCLMAAQ